MPRRPSRLAGVCLAALLAAAALPASAQIRPADRQRAAQEHPALLAQFGGAYRGPQQAYLEQIGDRVAAAGARGQCTFTLVNTDVVNAFAVPGCYVYVTRGLMGIANSDDELAFVLGHEVGHILARHPESRQNRSVLTGLGALILGAIAGDDRVGQLAGQGAQLWTLSFSRNQEHEADELALRYLPAAGFDPAGASNMLTAMQRSDQLRSRMRGRDEASGVPEWARTHPLTGDRIAKVNNRVRDWRLAPGQVAAGDRYFEAVDGLLFGDDPSQGFIMGTSFAHPQMRVAFQAPRGFTLTNSTQAVLIEGPGGVKAQFAGGRMPTRSLEDYARRVIASTAGQSGYQLSQPRYTSVGGVDTVIQTARVQTSSGLVDLTVAAYQPSGDTAYHFVTLAPAGRSRVFDPLFGSFRTLSPREAAELRPRRINVVTVRQGETVADIIRRMDVENASEWFWALNAIPPDGQVRPGQRVKIIAEGRG